MISGLITGNEGRSFVQFSALKQVDNLLIGVSQNPGKQRQIKQLLAR